MPVVSRDLSSHSWGSIAIGQHHAIGQVGKFCFDSLIFSNSSQVSALIMAFLLRRRTAEFWRWVEVNMADLALEMVKRLLTVLMPI